MKRALRYLVLAGVLTTATTASAREPTPDEVERARTFFNAGAAAYEVAKYRDAVRSFEQAYELSPRPQVLFSLAQAERKEFFASNNAAYLRRAIQHYKEYLDQVPTRGVRRERKRLRPASPNARRAQDTFARRARDRHRCIHSVLIHSARDEVLVRQRQLVAERTVRCQRRRHSRSHLQPRRLLSVDASGAEEKQR